MAEVGLVRFAQVAVEVGKAAVSDYRTKFSKHLFTQPQLLAVLCLMRYEDGSSELAEDWSFREAEVRLREHVELRDALGMSRVPDHTTFYYFLRKLEEKTLTRALAEVVCRLPLPPVGGTVLAVDATGLAPGAISTFFVKRTKDRGNGFPWRHYLKWLIAVDVSRKVLLAQAAKRGPANDSATLRPVVDAASLVAPLRLVLADAEFDSERNHQHIREALGVQSVIPAKRGKASWRRQGVRAQTEAEFPSALYRQRALVESVFSAAKRKLSSRAPGSSLATQRLQAFLLGLAYNIYRLKPRLKHQPFAFASSSSA